jgi:hypothetical protein
VRHAIRWLVVVLVIAGALTLAFVTGRATGSTSTSGQSNIATAAGATATSATCAVDRLC